MAPVPRHRICLIMSREWGRGWRPPLAHTRLGSRRYRCPRQPRMGMAFRDDTDLQPRVSIFKPVKILVVDDDAGTRRCLCRLLETFGYTCTDAADGADALGRTRTLMPQAIIMDLNMPRLDGFEAIRRIKSDPATRSIPVLALTASASFEDQRHASVLGVNAFLTKPTNLSELLARLRQLAPLPIGELN